MPETSPRLPFEIDEAIDPTLVTGRAGVPLVIEVFRQLGVAHAIDTHVAVKQRQRGLPPSQLVESLIALWTSGGDRCQDARQTRLRGLPSRGRPPWAGVDAEAGDLGPDGLVGSRAGTLKAPGMASWRAR